MLEYTDRGWSVLYDYRIWCSTAMNIGWQWDMLVGNGVDRLMTEYTA